MCGRLSTVAFFQRIYACSWPTFRAPELGLDFIKADSRQLPQGGRYVLMRVYLMSRRDLEKSITWKAGGERLHFIPASAAVDQVLACRGGRKGLLVRLGPCLSSAEFGIGGAEKAIVSAGPSDCCCMRSWCQCSPPQTATHRIAFSSESAPTWIPVCLPRSC